MKNLAFTIITLLTFTFVACTKDDAPKPTSTQNPQACIELPKDTLFINEGIRFFSCGDVVDSYHWDFDDGITSNEKIPVHQFSTPGTYLVELIVSKNQRTVKTIVPVTVVKPSFTDNGDLPDNTNAGVPSLTLQDLVLRP